MEGEGDARSGRGLVVGAGGLVVAAANGGIEDVSGIVDVGAETVWSIGITLLLKQ